MNYEDSNINIGIPIFAIHGNHDDPIREVQRSLLMLRISIDQSGRSYFLSGHSVHLQVAQLL